MNLSSQMDVSISTVLQAYMILKVKDWIEAKPQSGLSVRLGRNLPPEPKASTPSPLVTRVGISEPVAQVFQSAHYPEMVQLALSTPSPDDFPVKRLNRLMAAATRRAGARARSYDFPPGMGGSGMRSPSGRSMRDAGSLKSRLSRPTEPWRR